MKKSIGRLLSILHRQSQIYINYALKDFNITSAEYAFLLYLYKNDGLTQDALSAYLYVDKAATARAIQSLEHKGYVKKSKDSIDKRCNRVYLTDLAKKHREEIWHRIGQWNDFLTKDMDEMTKNIVIHQLEMMVQKIEATNLKNKLEE